MSSKSLRTESITDSWIIWKMTNQECLPNIVMEFLPAEKCLKGKRIKYWIVLMFASNSSFTCKCPSYTFNFYSLLILSLIPRESMQIPPYVKRSLR